MKRFKRILILVTVNLIATILLFLVLNLIAWPFSPKDSAFWANPLMQQYPIDQFDPGVTAEEGHENNNPSRVVRYVPDENKWYRLDPEPHIPERGPLVLNFEDSSTWGWGLADRRAAYPSVLDRLLAEQGIRSVNLGVPGYSSVQGRRYVEELLPRLSNRVVAITLYFGNNDGTENGRTDKEMLELARRRENSFLHFLRRFPLCRLVMDWANEWKTRDNRRPRVSPQEYGDNMRAMIGLAHAHGVPVIVIEPPVRLTWPPGHLTFVVSLTEETNNDWVRAELAQAQELYRAGIQTLDPAIFEQALEHDWLVPRIKRAWLERLRQLEEQTTVISLPPSSLLAEDYVFEDYCHPSARVHRALAEEIAALIRR